ncbi:PilW family protein [Microbulbifer sp.]|uniref:PilW family protein n=1 Tax=Microbulbifer sp. TaxID=1908541 RepID=UPI003F3ACA8B
MRMNSRQRGLSLIELMIGIVLSSLLLLGVLQIFDSNRNTMRMQMAYSQVQESGRFATDFLTREIRMADFWGCAPNKDSIRNHLDDSDDDYIPAIHGQVGAGGVGGTNNAPSSSGVIPGIDDVKIGTDTLTLSGAENACGGTGRMVAGTNENPLQVSANCNVQAGQVVLISNCKAGELLTVTGVGSGDSGEKAIAHAAGVDGSDGEDQGWIKNKPRTLQEDYGTDSTILRPYSRTFFIADSNITGTPSLFMIENGRAAQELVPGIEDMQVLYGRDSTGDGVVDTWQEASNNPDQMEGVMVIRVQLLAASDGSVGVSRQVIDGTVYTDGRLRKLYTATAKIRNRGI